MDDLNPENLRQIDEQMAQQRGLRQKSILQNERKRLEQVQAQQREQSMMQQFSQRLEQHLNPRIGTEEDSDPQANFMTRLMLQMQRRHGGQPSQ